MKYWVKGIKTIAPIGIPRDTNENALPLLITNHLTIGTETNIFPGLLKFINPMIMKTETICHEFFEKLKKNMAPIVIVAARGNKILGPNLSIK
jgi:hypothetical protein